MYHTDPYTSFSTTISMTEIDIRSVLRDEDKARNMIIKDMEDLDNRSKVRVLSYLLELLK